MTIFRPAANTDDGYYTHASGGTLYTSGSYAYFGKSENAYDLVVRFPNVTIPPGSIISSAKITLQAYASLSGNTVTARIYGQDADNPATFSDAADYTARERTTAYADWAAVEAWTVDVDYDTPSLVEIIEEIIERPGWASGNAMAFFIEDNGSSSFANRNAKTYEGSTTLCARLDVEFVAPLSMSDNLVFADVVTAEITGDLSISISETLAFTEVVTGVTGVRFDVSENLIITETVTAQIGPVSPTAFETLAFTETITLFMIPSLGFEISDLNDHGAHDLLEIYSFTGTTVQNELTLVDPLEELLFDAHVGDTAALAGKEPLSVASFHALLERIGSFAGEERLELISFHGDPGVLADLVIVDPMDSARFDAALPAHADLRIVEPLERIWFHGSGIAYVHKAIVMNLKNFAVAEYKNFNFDSVVYFNGKFLGLNSQGIFLLEGNNDLGQLIQARVKSGTEDFGKKAITIPREAWAAYRSDFGEGALQLDIRVDEKTDLFPARFGGNGNSLKEHRSKLGRGIKARFFTWDLKNVSGSWFNLESLRILGDIIKRKTR